MNRRPNYVREWFKNKKDALRVFVQSLEYKDSGKKLPADELMKKMNDATTDFQQKVGFISDSYEKNGWHEANIDLNLYEDYNEEPEDDFDQNSEHYGKNLNEKSNRVSKKN